MNDPLNNIISQFEIIENAFRVGKLTEEERERLIKEEEQNFVNEKNAEAIDYN